MRSSKRSAYKVLITSGPTSVPIDDVRVITNRSTGEMGRSIARSLSSQGAKVTLLEGKVTTNLNLPSQVKTRSFFEYRELAKVLSEELKKGYDLVVHAAAVSDLEPVKAFKGKLSSGKDIVLKLRPTKKLVDDIKKVAPTTKLVAFKLTTCLRPQNIKKAVAPLFDKAGADIVLVNRVSKGYEALLVRKDGSRTSKVLDKKSIVKALLKEIKAL